jgi:hypothetical protein
LYNFKTSLHNVKRTGESDDYMAGTKHPEQAVEEQGSLPQIIFNDDGNRPEI